LANKSLVMYLELRIDDLNSLMYKFKMFKWSLAGKCKWKKWFIRVKITYTLKIAVKLCYGILHEFEIMWLSFFLSIQ